MISLLFLLATLKGEGTTSVLESVRHAPESGSFAAAHDTEDRIFLARDGLEQASRKEQARCHNSYS
jgi:hypothetical protein